MQVISRTEMKDQSEYILRTEEEIIHAVKKQGVTMIKNYKGIVSRDLISDVVEAITSYDNERTYRSLMNDFVINEEFNTLDEI